jgi:hypothetical protein
MSLHRTILVVMTAACAFQMGASALEHQFGLAALFAALACVNHGNLLWSRRHGIR